MDSIRESFLREIDNAGFEDSEFTDFSRVFPAISQVSPGSGYEANIAAIAECQCIFNNYVLPFFEGVPLFALILRAGQQSDVLKGILWSALQISGGVIESADILTGLDVEDVTGIGNGAGVVMSAVGSSADYDLVFHLSKTIADVVLVKFVVDSVVVGEVETSPVELMATVNLGLLGNLPFVCDVTASVGAVSFGLTITRAGGEDA